MVGKKVALPPDTFKLDKAMLDLMSGPMFSEANCCYVIMMVGHNIIKMPDWLPECYRDKRHCFETGIARLRWCTPALVSEMESDPELFVSTKASVNMPSLISEISLARNRICEEETGEEEQDISQPSRC